MIDVYTRPAVHFVGDTALCLLPWVHPGRLVAERGGGDRDEVNADAAQLLLRAARDMSDVTAKHRVLVFHGSIEGASLPTGIAIDEHASDILPVDQLVALGFDAVIAAHIHVPQSFTGMTWLAANEHAVIDPVFYTGSPLPLNFGEGGYDHGVWLLDVGEHTEARFLPIEGRRFVTVDVDLTVGNQLGLDETDTVAAAIATHLPLDDDIVRVRIRGTEQQTAGVDVAALKPLLEQAHKVYVAFEKIRGQRARVDEIDEEIAPLDAVALYAGATGMADGDAAALRDLTADYLERLGATA
jgi:DNA repair exonuclease SbcCD nuclease subunit